MLELRRHDPDGEEFGPDANVFGNEVGERLTNYQKAWSTLKLRVSTRSVARAARQQNGNRTWPTCGGICRSGRKKGHTLIQSVFGREAGKTATPPRINPSGA
jgi:hypothetical protein